MLVANYYIDTYDELMYLKDNIKYGVSISVNGELYLPSNNTIPNTFNYKDYLKNNGITYILNISKLEILDKKINFIYKIKNYLSKRIKAIDDTGYMEAFILGDKNYINSDIYLLYQKIGVTHLFAISGMHVGLLCSVIFKLLKKINDKSKYLFTSFILILYGFILGFPSSIKRCVLFFIINSINKIFKFEINSIKLLFLVIIFLVFAHYKIVFDVGFIFSVCTVFGIILCSDFINNSNYRVVRAFRLSLVAFIFSLPVTLVNFYQINILSIFYNMIYVPFVSILVYPLCLISFIFPKCYYLFFLIINILEVCTLFLSKIDFSCLFLNFNIIQVCLFYLVNVLVFYKKKYKYFVFLIMIIIGDLIYPYFDSSCYLYYFDVSQGDSSMIITPYRKEVILIDTGGIINYNKEKWMKKSEYYVSSNIITFMKSLGIFKIDYLIITHGDYDHMGDAIYLVNNYDIDRVIFNCGEINDLEYDLIKVLDDKGISYYSCISELKLNNSNKLLFLNSKIYDNENDNSNVLYFNIYNYKLLFMGDAGVDVEEKLIEKYNLKDIDFIKIGHHGSKTSSSKEFIDTINPKYSIISVGKNNRYGHPNKEALDNLENSKIYRTDLDGTVEVVFNNKAYKISNYSP